VFALHQHPGRVTRIPCRRPLTVSLVLGVTLAATLTAVASSTSAQAAGAAVARPHHVFVINLENTNYFEAFGPDSPAPYLSKTLRAQGQLLTRYYAVAHNSLPNYIAQISGQAPGSDTQADCPIYRDFVGTGTVAPGQAVGQGCIYPTSVTTVADQLSAAGRSWKAYLEDMGNSPTESATCRHPAMNTPDDTQKARVGDQYAARHNPFVYFHSILDGGRCDTNDVPLDRLPADLSTEATTANFTYLTPNLCHDGHDQPCVDGRPGGLVSADAWLSTWVPRILASPAYRHDGLVVITFDEAEASGTQADTTACCNEQAGPNSPMPGITGPGGGRVGAVLLSRFIRPGSTNTHAYNHYALLASIEKLFGLGRLGFAGATGLRTFGADVYNASTTP